MLVGCSPTTNHKLARFFFDGVPDLETRRAISEMEQQYNQIENDSLLVNIAAVDLPTLVHAPYKERACKKCHDRGAMGQPRLPIPELCNTCHVSMEQQYSVVHAPVNSSGCIQCHSPHFSKLDKMLLREGQDLCLHCHDKEVVFENKIHKSIADTNCIECHNPHGSNSKMLLANNACFNCHENYLEENKVVHGPVASGNCAICHEAHDSKKYKKLVKFGNNLCLDCHTDSDIYSSPYHTDTTLDCLNCHNPHGSAHNYLLKKTGL